MWPYIMNRDRGNPIAKRTAQLPQSSPEATARPLAVFYLAIGCPEIKLVLSSAPEDEENGLSVMRHVILTPRHLKRRKRMGIDQKDILTLSYPRSWRRSVSRALSHHGRRPVTFFEIACDGDHRGPE